MKPTIYISSTIYDFADLRASLKYVLEELGYTVLLSDFNDFKKPLDKNSYDSCLAALKEADYFLLLIGQRVGGFVDANQKTSITRMEYREAYKLSKAGKLKLLTFVRKSLWDIREDRKALTRVFEELNTISKELSEESQKKLHHHSSTFVNDAEVTFEFLKEVSRTEEMKAAIDGAGDFPIGNWVHTFSIFADIMATLNVELNIKNPLRREIIVTNLKNEFVKNLAALLNKDSDGKIFATSNFYGMSARRCLTSKMDGGSMISRNKLKWLGLYLLFAAPLTRMSTQFLDEALTSGEFLSFQKESSTFEFSPLQSRMSELKENMDRLRILADDSNDWRSRLAQEFRDMPKDDHVVTIKNEKLHVAFALQDCEQNVVMLLSKILKYLNGDENALQNIQLNPPSPFAEIVESQKEEQPTKTDVLAWLKLQP